MAIYSANDAIKAFMASLHNTTLLGTDALNEAVQASSNFNTLEEVVAKMITDCTQNDSDTFLQDYCGIILDNEDTGAITGSDAGGSTTKTAESVVPETGDLNTSFTGNSFTTNGVTFQLASLDASKFTNHYSSITYNSLDTDRKYMWQGLYTWWANSALNLVTESYGDIYSFYSSPITTIHSGFVNESGNGTLAAVGYFSFGNRVFDLDFYINAAYYQGFDTTNLNGISSVEDVSKFYLDRTIAHEMTHAVMGAHVYGFDSLPRFVAEGLAELTCGIDDERKDLIQKLAADPLSLSSCLNFDEHGVVSSEVYAAGYMLFRYFAKQASDAAVDAVWSVDGTSAILGNDSETLLTVSGLKSGLTASDGTVTGITFDDDKYINISNAVLDSDSTLALTNHGILTNGLKLESDVTTADISNSWSLDNGTAYYNMNANSDGYYLNGNTVTYLQEGDSETLVTLGGVNNISGITVNEDTISVAASALSNSIQVGANYTFAFTGNNLANKTITGSDANDSVYVNGNGAVVSLGGGNDYLVNKGNRVTIIGGDDNSDYIENSGVNVNINTGTGEDYVLNRASNVTITSANVYNLGVNVAVTASTVGNLNSNVIITGTGDDSIYNDSNNVTINTGDGIDTIANKGSYVLINAGAGNDTIDSEGNYMTIDAGDGDDLISDTGKFNVINFSAGDDTLFGITDSDTIVVSGYYDLNNDGVDVIINVGEDYLRVVNGANVDFTIDGTPAGNYYLGINDTININDITFTALESSTITANANNTLTLTGKATAVITGTENPIITLNSATFNATLSDNTLAISTTDGTVNYVAGSAVYDSTVTITSGTTLTADYANFTLADKGAYNVNSVEVVTPAQITLSANNDSISFNPNSQTVTVGGASITGDGNFIFNDNYITGTAGSDTIITSAKSTVKAGAGDDLIDVSNAANVVVYNSGDGNDSIVGFSSDDSLQVNANYSTIKSGDELIVGVNDSYITVSGSDFKIGGGTATINATASNLVDGLLKRGTTLASNFVATSTVVTPSQYSSTETWTVTASDGTTLSATHFAPTEATGRWVVLLHGYGQDRRGVYSYVDSYLQQGYHVLTPDSRGVGNSGGDYLTMGILEAADIAKWSQEIVDNYSSALITLHGVSTGAAAAVIASARSDIENVTAVIADSSYNTAYDYFYDNLQTALNINPDPVMLFVDELAESTIGYSLKDAAPIDAVTNTTVATLFINSADLYNASKASIKQSADSYNLSTALAFIDTATPTNIIFNGTSIVISNADGDTMNVNTADYATFANRTLTLKDVGDRLNILISGNNSIVNIDSSTLRTSSSNITTVRAVDTDIIKINGDNYTLTDHAVSIIMAADNHISSITQLDGIIAGNFSYGTTAINGTDRIYIQGDSDVTVTADTTNRITNVDGISDGATVVAAGTNSTLTTDSTGTFTVDNIKFTTAQDSVTFTMDRRGSLGSFNADTATILGTSGNDTITAYGNNFSINASTGNDIITLSSDTHNHIIDYNAGDGNDTIIGLSANDTLNIAVGTYSSILSGDDVIITVGENTIFAKEAANTDFVIDGLQVGELILGAGESITIGDIVYAATDDATLTANADNSLSINNGKISATFNGMVNPEISFSADDGEFKFVCTKVGDALAVTVDDITTKYTAGNVTYYADKLVGAQGTVEAMNNAGFASVDVTVSNADGDTISNKDSVIAYNGATTLNAVISDNTITSASFNGSFSYNRVNHNLNISDGTSLVSYFNGSPVTLAANGDIGGSLYLYDDRFTFIPFTDDGSLEFYAIDDQTTIDAKGSITYYYNGDFVLTSDTSIAIRWHEDYRLDITANSSVAGNISLDKDALIISPADFKSFNTSFSNSYYTVDNLIFDAPFMYHEGTMTLPAAASLAGTISGNAFEVSAMNNDAEFAVLDEGFEFTGNMIVGTLSNKTNYYNGVLTVFDAVTPIISSGTAVTTAANSTQQFILDNSGNFTIDNYAITTPTLQSVSIDANSLAFNPNSNLVTVDNKVYSGDGIVSVFSDGSFDLNDGAAVVMASGDAFTIDNIPVRVSRNIAGGVTVSSDDGAFDISSSINGGIMKEKLAVSGDNDYSVSIVASGIGTVSGISSGATIKGGATFNGNDTIHSYQVQTDGNSVYTFGEKTYTITGDDEVNIIADYGNDNATVKSVDGLSGTISGDFSNGVTVNGDYVEVAGGASVVADNNGVEEVNVSNGATVISAADGTIKSSGTVEVNGLSVSGEATIVGETLVSGEATINGTDSGDVINNSGANVLINGNGGNDTIRSSGANVTIVGGSGDDYISVSGGGNVIVYNSGDGNDTIAGTSDDTLKVTSGNYSTVQSGNNVVVKVSTGQLTLSGGVSIDGLEVGIFTLASGESRIVDDITFTATENATLTANEDGTFAVNNGAVNVVLTGTNDPEVTFDASDGEFEFGCVNSGGALEVTSGNMTMKYTTGKLTYYADKITSSGGVIGLVDDSGNVSVNLVANGGSFSFDNGVFAFTDSGKTTATINYSDTTISNISFSGSWTYDKPNSTLSVARNSTLKATVVNREIELTTTATAGGRLTVDDSTLSITYAPNSDDGALTLSVTQSGTTRKTTLNCVGSVTYTLGGEIELAAGTTVTNSWSSGYELAITSSRAAGGAINLIDDGLKITPYDSDAVVLALTTPAGVTISNIKIDGTVIYHAGSLKLLNGGMITATQSGKTMQYIASDGDIDIDFGAENLTITPENSIIGTAGNVTINYSDAPVKIGSDTDVVILTPNIKITTAGTSTQELAFESSGAYNLNGVDYVIKDDDGAKLTYNNNIFEISDLDGTLEMSLGADDTVGASFYLSNGDERAAFGVTAADFEAGVRSATIKSDGYFAANLFENFDIYTLHSARAGTYTLGYPAIKVDISGDSNYDFLFDSATYVTVVGISNGADITVQGEHTLNTPFNVEVKNEAGTYYLNGNTIEASGETAVTVNTDRSISFNPSYVTYNGLKFYSDSDITVPSSGALTLNDGEGVTLSSGEYNINDHDVFVNGNTTIYSNDGGYKVNDDNIKISGDDEYSLTLNGGIEAVNGISSGTTITGDGTFDIITDSDGEFKLGNKTYGVGDDFSVKMNVTFSSDTATLNTVSDLEGTISGDFRNSIEVNGTAVQITGDSLVSVVADGMIETVSGISDGATVNSVGDNTTLITDGAGTFKFNDFNVTTKNSAVYVNNSNRFRIDNATIEGTTEAENITNSGAAASINAGSGDDYILNSGDEATITTSNGSTTIENSGADVVIDANNITFEVIGDNNYNVTTSNSGATVEGLNGGSTITANSGNLTAITNSTGVFTFGDSAITVLGDNSVNVNVNYNNGIRSVTDLQGTLIFINNATQTINDNTLTISPTGQQITLRTDNDGTIQSLNGLEVGGTLNFGTSGTFTVNGESIRITDPVNQVITCTENGITVTYPTTELEQSWVNNSSSDYISTVEGYTDASDTNNGNLVYYLNDDVNANFEETTGKKKVILGDGNITVAFNGDGGNIASIQAETGGNKIIKLGDGGDVVIVEDTDSAVSIKTGSGADKISSHGDDVTIDMSAGGATKIMASGGNVTLTNYDHNSGAGIQGIYGTGENDFNIGDGYIEMLGAQIVFGGSGNSAVFNMYDSDGEVTKIGFTYLNGGVVDLSSQTTGVQLISRNGNSTLKGGSRNDTVESAGDDYINAGAGNNIINLNHTNYANGATIAATEGHNTVNGLYNNIDRFEVSNFGTVDFTYDGELTIKDGTARTYINTGSADGSSDYTTLLLQDTSGDSLKAAITGDNGTITADTASRAYIGTRAGVDFSGLSGDLNINVNDSVGTYNGETMYFRGINKLTAGSGNTTMISSNSNSTLTAGSGNTSMLGGTGNDLLVGNFDGNTNYFFTSNGGKDTITNFSSDDTITTFNAVVTSVRTLNNDVLVDFGNDLLRIADAVDEDIRFDGIVAKIGNGVLTYDNDATYYQANSSNATLEVAASVTAADIWLNDGGKYGGDFKVLDASNSNGLATLAGNDKDNVIVAGSGNSSLWGGNGGNDTLTGGSASDMFWYLRGNGNDVIVNASEGDSINLYDWTLADITSAEITSGGVNITFNDGGSLSVSGGNVNAVFMIDGLRYRANQSSRTWVEA